MPNWKRRATPSGPFDVEDDERIDIGQGNTMPIPKVDRAHHRRATRKGR
jgi:hypothetical protein